MKGIRNLWIDRIKFILIFLVILGHVGFVRNTFLDISIGGELTNAMKEIIRLIYLFHMPAFILISGYLTTSRPIVEAYKKSTKFIKLYLIFHVFNIILSVVCSSSIPSLKELLYPSFGLWYLLALFLWRILLAFVERWYNGLFFIVCSCMVSSLSVLLPIPSVFGLNRFVSFMPFFIIGYVVRKEWQIISKQKNWEKLIKWGGQLCLLLSICILAFIEMPPFYGIERGLSFSMVLTRLGHIGLALLLCGAFFPLLKLLPQNEQLFVYGGEQSLFIYLYHPYVLLLLSYISSFMFHEITVLMGVILALLTTAILLCLSRVKIFQKIIL